MGLISHISWFIRYLNEAGWGSVGQNLTHTTPLPSLFASIISCLSLRLLSRQLILFGTKHRFTFFNFINMFKISYPKLEFCRHRLRFWVMRKKIPSQFKSIVTRLNCLGVDCFKIPFEIMAFVQFLAIFLFFAVRYCVNFVEGVWNPYAVILNLCLVYSNILRGNYTLPPSTITHFSLHPLNFKK